MSGLESDTIGGFNSLIKSRIKEAGNTFVTTVFFNRSKLIHDRMKIENVPPRQRRIKRLKVVLLCWTLLAVQFVLLSAFTNMPGRRMFLKKQQLFTV